MKKFKKENIWYHGLIPKFFECFCYLWQTVPTEDGPEPAVDSFGDTDLEKDNEELDQDNNKDEDDVKQDSEPSQENCEGTAIISFSFFLSVRVGWKG